MLRMRLTRVGSKKRPAYRLVVADSRAPRDGRHVDIVGHYNPMAKPAAVNIDVERAVQWLRNGAQPSERVRILLRHSGVLKAHEEARIADKKARKESPPVRAAKKAAGEVAGAARTAFKVIVRGAGKAADAVADAAESAADALPARRTRARAGAGTAGKTSSKSAAKKASAKTSAAAKKSAAKSTTAAKSAERAAARKSAAKAAKS